MCVIAEPRKVTTRNVVEVQQKNKGKVLLPTSLIQKISSERPSLLNIPGHSTSIETSYFHYLFRISKSYGQTLLLFSCN
jgi:hypothetical protein